MGQFWGPLIGAFTLVALNQQITSYTEYWPLVLGLLLIVLLYAFPSGLVGTAVDAAAAIRRRRNA
jgi:branched-chain amino acid transport system permease protein